MHLSTITTARICSMRKEGHELLHLSSRANCWKHFDNHSASIDAKAAPKVMTCPNVTTNSDDYPNILVAILQDDKGPIPIEVKCICRMKSQSSA